MLHLKYNKQPTTPSVQHTTQWQNQYPHPTYLTPHHLPRFHTRCLAHNWSTATITLPRASQRPFPNSLRIGRIGSKPSSQLSTAFSVGANHMMTGLLGLLRIQLMLLLRMLVMMITHCPRTSCSLWTTPHHPHLPQLLVLLNTSTTSTTTTTPNDVDKEEVCLDVGEMMRHCQCGTATTTHISSNPLLPHSYHHGTTTHLQPSRFVCTQPPWLLLTPALRRIRRKGAVAHGDRHIFALILPPRRRLLHHGTTTTLSFTTPLPKQTLSPTNPTHSTQLSDPCAPGPPPQTNQILPPSPLQQLPKTNLAQPFFIIGGVSILKSVSY